MQKTSPVLLTVWQVNTMADYKIQRIFARSYAHYTAQGHFQSDVQCKAARAILNCKSGKIGFNLKSVQRLRTHRSPQ